MNTKNLRFFGLIIAVVTIPVSTNAQTAVEIPDFDGSSQSIQYRYIVNKNSNKCAQVNGASKANGAVISQWSCIDQDNVKWAGVPTGDGDHSWYIVNKNSNKCAQVNGASKANGAVISQWTCVNQKNVKWVFVPTGDGDNSWYIVNKNSNKCAQVNGASKANGAVISQWTCVNQKNVKWYVVPTEIEARHDTPVGAYALTFRSSTHSPTA